MNPDPIVIVSAARTPMGAFQGELKGFAAPELGAAAIRAAVERAKLKPEDVQEVIMGCVLPAGQGQAPARQAAFKGGLPKSAGAVTIAEASSRDSTPAAASACAHAMLPVTSSSKSARSNPKEMPKSNAAGSGSVSNLPDHSVTTVSPVPAPAGRCP